MKPLAALVDTTQTAHASIWILHQGVQYGGDKTIPQITDFSVNIYTQQLTAFQVSIWPPIYTTQTFNHRSGVSTYACCGDIRFSSDWSLLMINPWRSYDTHLVIDSECSVVSFGGRLFSILRFETAPHVQNDLQK